MLHDERDGHVRDMRKELADHYEELSQNGTAAKQNHLSRIPSQPLKASGPTQVAATTTTTAAAAAA